MAIFFSEHTSMTEIWKYDSEQKHQHLKIWEDFWSELQNPVFLKSCLPKKYIQVWWDSTNAAGQLSTCKKNKIE